MSHDDRLRGSSRREAANAQPDDPLRLQATGFWIGSAIVAGFAVWLAWGEDIVGRDNPYDQLRYLAMAEEIAAGRWLGDWNALTGVREPGYSLWVAAVHGVGVPLRLANEVATIAAALALGASLRRLGVSAFLALAVVALVALQPHAALTHRELLPSSLYGAGLVASLAGFGLSVAAGDRRSRWLHLGWTACVLGVLWITRAEAPLVAVWIATLAALDMFGQRVRGVPWPRAVSRSALALVVLSSGPLLAATAVAAHNARHYGSFELAETHAAGFLAANTALLSIPHDAPRRYVPVPEDARRRAYAVSPTLAARAAALEGPSWARGVSCIIGGVCDDISGGHFRWILRESFAREADSAQQLDATLTRVAREIQAACEGGHLECRSPLSSFLHPYPETWLNAVGPSLGLVARRIGSFGHPRDRTPERDPIDLDPALRARFDAMAGRRVEASRYPRDSISVHITRGDESVVSARVDVAGTRTDARIDGDEISAEFERPFLQPLLHYPVLELQLTSQEIMRIPLPQTGGSASAEGFEIAVERWERGTQANARAAVVRAWTWPIHAVVVRILSVAGLAAAIVLAISPHRRGLGDPVLLVIVALAVVVAARVALLTVIDASSFPSRSSRYLHPIVPLYSAGMLLLTRQAWRRLRERQSLRVSERGVDRALAADETRG